MNNLNEQQVTIALKLVTIIRLLDIELYEDGPIEERLESIEFGIRELQRKVNEYETVLQSARSDEIKGLQDALLVLLPKFPIVNGISSYFVKHNLHVRDCPHGLDKQVYAARIVAMHALGIDNPDDEKKQMRQQCAWGNWMRINRPIVRKAQMENDDD